MNTKRNRAEIVTTRLRAIAVVLSGAMLITLTAQGFLPFVPVPVNSTVTSPRVNIKEELRAPKGDVFANIALEARAVFVFDLATGKILFSQNENDKLPLASITKIMTALVAREHISQGAVVTLTKDDLSAEGDTGLLSGERWRMGDLLDVMLIVSSNDSARAVSAFVGSNGQVSDPNFSRARFVQRMNEKALALGFNTMEFFNESGLDVSETRNGGYGSAREVALLFAELWKKYPTSVEITARKDARIYSQDKIAHFLQNTNEVTGRFPGLVGSKTGYTALAGGNLAIIFDRGIGSPVVIVVLGSTYKGRFEDMQKLVQATIKTPE